MGAAYAYGIAGLIIWVVSFAVGMWVFYYVIKCAVRDGIKESGLVRAPGRDWAATVREAQRTGVLPDMRAD